MFVMQTMAQIQIVYCMSRIVAGVGETAEYWPVITSHAQDTLSLDSTGTEPKAV